MQKRSRWRGLVVLRRLLIGAICSIAAVALLSVHVHVFLSSKVPDFSDSYKLPTVTPSILHFLLPPFSLLLSLSFNFRISRIASWLGFLFPSCFCDFLKHFYFHFIIIIIFVFHLMLSKLRILSFSLIFWRQNFTRRFEITGHLYSEYFIMIRNSFFFFFLILRLSVDLYLERYHCV